MRLGRRFLGILLICLVLGSVPVLVERVYQSPLISPPVKVETSELTLRVLNHNTGQIMQLSLEKYLLGVVAAEMPASFHPSALAAQAIAARTYTLKRIESDSGNHPAGVDICTDFYHCQDWISEEEMQKRWGALQFISYHRRIQNAVDLTRGMVITFQGKLIDPLYHSTCGGKTENSEDVWVYSIPYLRSVNCPYCQDSPHYQESRNLSWNEIQQRLSFAIALPATAGEKPQLIRVAAQSPTGRQKKLIIAGRNISASELRSKLGLNSTRFSWQEDQSGVTFLTQGYGHGVGLCQYGAQGMAKQGRSPQEILRFYYTGADIQQQTKLE